VHRWLNSVAWILAAPGCDGGGHDSGPVSDLDVVELPVTPCTAPSEPGFDPISLGAGWGGSGWERDAESQYSGGGVVAADFNGDDVPDLFLAHVGPDELWLSEDGAWTRSVVPYHVDELTVGGVAADHDGDGDVDLYVVVLHGPNRLLENDGSGTFAEVEGADDGWHDSTGATFADVDADGDLDLLVSNHRETEALEQELLAREMTPAHPNGLYLNGSDGWEAGELPETWASGYTFVTAAEDLDDDGVLDLYSVNDFGPFHEPNTWLRGPDWVEDAGAEVAVFGMGLAVGDLNGDRRPELLSTSWMDNALLESSPDGTWYRAEDARGLTFEDDQLMAWGADFSDLDNDGDLDLTMAFGPLLMPDDAAERIEDGLGLSNPANQPDAIFLQQADGSFAAADWGVGDRGVGRGFAVVDLDGDGWLDLVKRELDGPAKAYRGRCGTHGFLSIALAQDGPNPQAIGAVVRWGDQQRTVRAGGHGHAGSVPAEVHFGLGEASEADLEILWPDGVQDHLTLSAGRYRVSR